MFHSNMAPLAFGGVFTVEKFTFAFSEIILFIIKVLSLVLHFVKV